jgi:chromosome partitioning protein
LIVDSAGSATRTLAAILRVADVVLIPCRASPLDAEGAMNTMGLLQEYRRTPVSVGVVLNATGRTVLVEHIRSELKAAGMSVMKTQIGQRIAFAEAQLHGSAPCWMGKSAQKASAEIKALTSELLHFLKY